MLLNIDLRESLLMIALVVLCGTTLYATHRSTKALKNEIAQKPEVPDIVQMASLEEATGFKVVDKEGYQSLQKLNTATSALPGRVDRVEQKLMSTVQELNDIKRSLGSLMESILTLRQDSQDRSVETIKAFSDLDENLRSAMSAVFQRLEEDSE
jgi:biopolymer transport protein ExbB/TolQ|tara:strand:+ start:298 stop:759 length:462 start_codon:yes stop_codon:yes gene_type:complete